MKPAWTRHGPLPGGDMPGADFDAFQGRLLAARPWLPEALGLHYARLYGTRTDALLGHAGSLDDLGRRFGPEFHELEANYLREPKWAITAEDVMWRRTKHGLRMSEAERDAFRHWFESDLALSA